MPLPTTIVSAAGIAGYCPPFKSSGGDFYVLALTDTTAIDVYKATDPTDSWVVQDSANNPDLTTVIDPCTAAQNGDIIDVLLYTSDTLFYGFFDMSDDTWFDFGGPLDTVEIVDSIDNAPTHAWVSCIARGGDTIVAYAGDTDQVMGGKKERVDYARRDGSPLAWTAGIALDAAGDTHYGNPNAVLGTNDGTHMLWQQQSITDDPPTGWGRVRARTLDSSNSLSTVATDPGGETGSNMLGFYNMVALNDPTTSPDTHRMIMAAVRSGGQRITDRLSEDGSDDAQFVSTDFASGAVDRYTNGEVGVGSVVENAGELHVLFAGGGTDGVDQDLYYTTSDDFGATWATDTEEIDAITVNFISATVYVRGADTVMAYVYDDGGVQKYNEKVLIAGGAPDFLPYYNRRDSVLLRM